MGIFETVPLDYKSETTLGCDTLTVDHLLAPHTHGIRIEWCQIV
jgi:hypothetical protein